MTSGKKAVAVKNLWKRYGTLEALKDVSLEIAEGEFFGLLGPNGAGKSTLLNILSGYTSSDEGSVKIGGRSMLPTALDIRANIGLVPQSIALYEELSAQQNLEIFGSFYGLKGKTLKERIESGLNAVQLYDRRKDAVKTFSGGMKRRLNLTASLLHRPSLLFCDEPTVGVDPQSRHAIFDFLQRCNEEGLTIIYTTHYMEEAQNLCNQIAIIDHGKIIAEGSTSQLIDSLPFEEEIIIEKTEETQVLLSEFGHRFEMIENGDSITVHPGSNFRMSEFYQAVERHGLSYRLFQVKQPTLEALFLHHTGRHLRE